MGRPPSAGNRESLGKTLFDNHGSKATLFLHATCRAPFTVRDSSLYALLLSIPMADDDHILEGQATRTRSETG